MEFVFLLVLLWVLFFELIYPIGVFEFENCRKKGKPQTENQKSFVIHVHTCFSYDSLGKPEELEKAANELGISKVFITDHDNDLFKRVSPASREIFEVGMEYQDPNFGRLLKLSDGLFVVAHPNHGKKEEYRWRGKYPENFLYELVDLKDVLVGANIFAKIHQVVRFIFLYPFAGLKALDFFPKMVPIAKWVEIYLGRTDGKMAVVGGLDHHVKLTLWEKSKKNFSFPSYLWSFYILQNRTWEGEVEDSLKRGKIYLSFCREKVSKEKSYLLFEGKGLTLNFLGNGKVKANLCGRIEKGAKAVVLCRYSFRLGKFFFGLRPAVVFATLRER